MRQLILQILREETQPLHEDKITQVVNSLLKKYIPDNSTFETWFSTPYDDNERVDVYIEYSFDEKDTYFGKRIWKRMMNLKDMKEQFIC